MWRSRFAHCRIHGRRREFEWYLYFTEYDELYSTQPHNQTFESEEKTAKKMKHKQLTFHKYRTNGELNFVALYRCLTFYRNWNISTSQFQLIAGKLYYSFIVDSLFTYTFVLIRCCSMSHVSCVRVSHDVWHGTQIYLQFQWNEINKCRRYNLRNACSHAKVITLDLHFKWN